jgi:hypothetical protein
MQLATWWRHRRILAYYPKCMLYTKQQQCRCSTGALTSELQTKQCYGPHKQHMRRARLTSPKGGTIPLNQLLHTHTQEDSTITNGSPPPSQSTWVAACGSAAPGGLLSSAQPSIMLSSAQPSIMLSGETVPCIPARHTLPPQDAHPSSY